MHFLNANFIPNLVFDPKDRNRKRNKKFVQDSGSYSLGISLTNK